MVAFFMVAVHSDADAENRLRLWGVAAKINAFTTFIEVCAEWRQPWFSILMHTIGI
jgi:hypothetical protein